MKKLLTIILAIAMMIGMPVATFARGSSEITLAWETSGWALASVEEANGLGIVPDRLQNVDLTQSVTRLEFAIVIMQLYETLLGESVEPAPVDTFVDTWDIAARKAYQANIVSGVGNGMFAPQSLLTREEAVTMLSRVYKALYLEGWALENDYLLPLDMDGIRTFDDDDEISDWAKASIYFAVQYGIVAGVGDNRMAPKDNLSWEQALVVSSRFFISFEHMPIALQELPSAPSRSSWEATLAWNTSSWATASIEKANELGLVPNRLEHVNLRESTTRLEFAVVIMQLYEKLSGEIVEPAPVDTFVDTQDIAARKAFAVNIVSGVGNGRFVPDALLTREEAVTMLSRLYKVLYLEGWELENDYLLPLDMTGIRTFDDDNEMSDWARPSIYFAVRHGIVAGIGNNRMAPKDNLSWEQALVLSLRFFRSFEDMPRVPQETLSSNANLASLSVAGHEIAPPFDKNNLVYLLAVGNNVTSVTVNYRTEHAKATVRITGNTNLVVGSNTVRVTVTAEDGTTTRTYEIVVSRAGLMSDNAFLSSLSVAGRTISPTFNKNTLNYSLTVGNSVASVTVNYTTEHAKATVQVTGADNLSVGSNTVRVIVTAENGTTTRTYIINVTRGSGGGTTPTDPPTEPTDPPGPTFPPPNPTDPPTDPNFPNPDGGGDVTDPGFPNPGGGGDVTDTFPNPGGGGDVTDTFPNPGGGGDVTDTFPNPSGGGDVTNTFPNPDSGDVTDSVFPDPDGGEVTSSLPDHDNSDLSTGFPSPDDNDSSSDFPNPDSTDVTDTTEGE